MPAEVVELHQTWSLNDMNTLTYNESGGTVQSLLPSNVYLLLLHQMVHHPLRSFYDRLSVLCKGYLVIAMVAAVIIIM